MASKNATDMNMGVEDLKTEEIAFLDSATANPDRQDNGGGIPDHIAGQQLVLRNQISTQVDAIGVVASDATYDLWMVDWDVEVVTASYGYYRARNNSGANGLWDDTYGLQLPVGGLCLYVMASGRSPFPSDNPSTIGPVAPLRTIQLIFDSTLLQERSRVIGKNFKAAYTGNDLNRQGLITQSAMYNYKNENFCAINPGAVANNPSATFMADIIDMPPGSAPALMAYKRAVQKKVEKGVFQHAIMNYTDSMPQRKNGKIRIYFSSVKPTGSSTYLDLFIGNVLDFNAIITRTAGYWETSSNIHMAVWTGLIGNGTVQVSREMIVQNFPSYGDQFFNLCEPAPYCNDLVIQDMINAQRTSVQFWDFNDNASWKFAKSMISTYNKVKKIAAPIAKAVIPAPQLALINAAAKAAKPYTSVAKAVVGPKRTIAKTGTPKKKTKKIAKITNKLLKLKMK